jgi:hypothetical protein
MNGSEKIPFPRRVQKKKKKSRLKRIYAKEKLIGKKKGATQRKKVLRKPVGAR